VISAEETQIFFVRHAKNHDIAQQNVRENIGMNIAKYAAPKESLQLHKFFLSIYI